MGRNFESHFHPRYKDIVSGLKLCTLRDVFDSAWVLEKNKLDAKKAQEAQVQPKAKVVKKGKREKQSSS